MMDILKLLSAKKKELDSFKPLPPAQSKSLEQWLDNEYTYTSNAIEGSTLSRAQTAMVVEKGITVAGKTLREQLEAVNHNQAIIYIRQLIKEKSDPITQENIKKIHQIILAGIDNDEAGRYRTSSVYIRGASIDPPPPHHVPFNMKDLVGWWSLQKNEHPVKKAADLHFKLVAIHPFVDGNGRTARLLMNLILMKNGYPLGIIKTDERNIYIDSLNEATVTGNLADFYHVIYTAVERSLDANISAAHGKSIESYFKDENIQDKREYVKIGALARLAKVSIPTVRYYLEQRLIKYSTKTRGGFMLFVPQVAEQILEIKRLQKESRLSIASLRKRLAK